MSGTLTLCATPIGNLADASPRLADALRGADVIYCEDTRRSRKLLTALGIRAPLRSYFVANEEARAQELGSRLAGGESVVLITDAGMPAIADPGLSAVRAAIDAGARVTVVPGPSAVTAALAVSGLPSERFVFEGFLPRKQEARDARLAELAGETRTIVVFVAAGRAATELAAMADRWGGERSAVVARELTKLHEDIWRGPLGEAVAHFGDERVRGELTVVIEGAPDPAGDLEAAIAEVGRLTGTGVSFSRAVRDVAGSYGVSRRALYETARRRRDSE
ncbi:MAG: 16S rRNA (cytidine(1402)-2'-O)-methyltransferase [Acidimicrobiia bacterium]|nr:16S rRNA (cytidine(1402)-2'-O)-methyltransferase [Acidimicrobiia bacterium]NNF09950.1 16S rRNA (cytidine(1402)-2'-O)-methyltransferase [Acidimicrobiia bacterium]NNL68721.1 16S rRNA (cytidine(1402)-2'-O)-methyltransferase [Acidimicrobiia bacterium]